MGLLDPPFVPQRDKESRPLWHLSDASDADTDTALSLYLLASGVPANPFPAEVILAEKPMSITSQPQRDDDTQALLARRMVRYMEARRYHIARSRAARLLNIVYLEGADESGQPNADTTDRWNDRRIVFFVDAEGEPRILHNSVATTEPGLHYTLNPMNKRGAARIAFGQYKAWRMGLHQGAQPALVQAAPVRVHRDGNRDGKRSSTDALDVGVFGINQHSTAPGFLGLSIGRHSAGCLVGKNTAGHSAFLSLLDTDPRYQNNPDYLFVTAVLPGDKCWLA